MSESGVRSKDLSSNVMQYYEGVSRHMASIKQESGAPSHDSDYHTFQNGMKSIGTMKEESSRYHAVSKTHSSLSGASRSKSVW